MERKILLDSEGNWYKANLHCHCTVSDGEWTAEKIKEEYQKQGYSVIAFTDHMDYHGIQNWMMKLSSQLVRSKPILMRRQTSSPIGIPAQCTT